MDIRTDHPPHRGPQASPTAAERRELLRRAKAIAATTGDPLALHAVALFEHSAELRAARRATTAPEERTPC